MAFARILVLLALFLTPPAFAEVLVGAGLVNKVGGLNLEWAFKKNTIYILPGYMLGNTGIDNHAFRWVVGTRHRLNDGTTDTDGFFSGFLVGDLGGTTHYERLGAGGELGYQWVKKYTRWTFSAGLGVLQKDSTRNLDTEPTSFLAVSVSLRK